MEPDGFKIIKFRAMPKYRARTFVDKTTKKIRTAHEPKYDKWKEQMGWLLRATFPGARFAGNISLSLRFGFNKASLGDIDNLAGGVMDAGNGVLWDDDRSIKALHVEIDTSSKEDYIAISITGGLS